MFATATTMDSLFTHPTTHKSNHHALAVQVLNACYKFVHPYTMPRHAKATCHTSAEPYVVQLYSIISYARREIGMQTLFGHSCIGFLHNKITVNCYTSHMQWKWNNYKGQIIPKINITRPTGRAFPVSS